MAFSGFDRKVQSPQLVGGETLRATSGAHSRGKTSIGPVWEMQQMNEKPIAIVHEIRGSRMNKYLKRVETRARRNYDRLMEELVDATL